MTLMQDMLREIDPLPMYAEVPATGAVVVEDGDVYDPQIRHLWASCACTDGRHGMEHLRYYATESEAQTCTAPGCLDCHPTHPLRVLRCDVLSEVTA